jgi:Uncharacterized domain/protein associated with RNAses G and E
VDEYAAHSKMWNYPPEIDTILHDNVDVLIDWIDKGKGPFSQAYVDLWMQRYNELSHH